MKTHDEALAAADELMRDGVTRQEEFARKREVRRELLRKWYPWFMALLVVALVAYWYFFAREKSPSVLVVVLGILLAAGVRNWKARNK